VNRVDGAKGAPKDPIERAKKAKAATATRCDYRNPDLKAVLAPQIFAVAGHP
jgi:hypothetical protein